MSFNLCSPECEILPIPFLQNACSPIVQRGGISHIIAASCRVPDLSTLELEDICDFARQGRVVISPPLLAELPAAETTSSDTRSCAPATITGYTQTLSFESYNHDPVNFAEFDFWRQLARNYTSFNFYYVGCDGLVYGPVPNPSFSVSHMIEQKNTGKAGFMGELSFTYGPGDFLKPFRVSGIVQALTGGCFDTPATGFTVTTPFEQTRTGVAGSATPVTATALTITRTSCTEPIIISVIDVIVITGGPNAPTTATTNIAGPSGTTGGQIAFNLQNADPGTYDYVYQLSACGDTFTGNIRVTVTGS